MAQTRVFAAEFDIMEGESPTLCGRFVRATDGVALQSGDVTGWTIEVYNQSSATPGTIVYINGPLLGSAGFSDTLLNDCDNLMGDTEGRNFLTVLDAGEIALAGGNTYLVFVKVDTTTYRFVQEYKVTVRAANG